ncbi:MAG: tRNA (N6-isopentenyl adenosine(37)-C2)-methylthiotransferase MiaB [Cyanobacteria bacterium SIG30]|nr:tRNA (N6-isopentenyl adenosine(37)-C2)-methylthiotransferase MiaB [Cyanobacteria bacterium SIG30]
MKKVYIETLGCQMNKSDSERIYAILSKFDYKKTNEPKEADFLIVNTCSIRQLSEEKAYSRLGVWGKWKKNKPELKIAICGCLPQHTDEDLLKRFPYLDLVFGTQNIYELPELLKEEKRTKSIKKKEYVPEKDVDFMREKSVNAWIPIIEGCNNFCTYCIVPFTRGRERSRKPEVIINEAKEIIKQGFQEITLLGQNVDSYGKDLEDKPTLAYLLREINKLEGKFRIRFVTSYPTDITDELIETVKNCEKVCNYFHIPAQSGNSAILKKMNRKYTREEYGAIVDKIRSQVPDVTITSDFIVGFPSETQEQFEDTLSLIDKYELDYSNIASYSPRPHTVASKMTDDFIDEKTKDERFQILNTKVKEMHLKSNKKFVNKIVEVLVEDNQGNILKGRTGNNKIVHFESDKYKIGDFVNVKIKSASVWHLKGEVI